MRLTNTWPNHAMQPAPKVLTNSFPLISASGFPIYVARVPAPPSASGLAQFEMSQCAYPDTLPWLISISLGLCVSYYSSA
jgi:hypothetical protein